MQNSKGILPEIVKVGLQCSAAQTNPGGTAAQSHRLEYVLIIIANWYHYRYFEKRAKK